MSSIRPVGEALFAELMQELVAEPHIYAREKILEQYVLRLTAKQHDVLDQLHHGLAVEGAPPFADTFAPATAAAVLAPPDEGKPLPQSPSNAETVKEEKEAIPAEAETAHSTTSDGSTS